MKSKIYSSVAGRDVRAIAFDAKDCADYLDLGELGIHIPEAMARKMAGAFAMDALQSMQTAPSIATPIQFLQSWLPGFVRIVTAPLNIDELIGVATVADWFSEEVVQGIIEPAGKAAVYGDQANVPLSSYNTNFETRSVVRFEQGFQVGILEEERAAQMNVNSAAEKRISAVQSLDINRNLVGFYGYNNGANRTYGFLNDPGLPAYVAAAAGTGGTTWATKTFDEICADVRAMAGRLITGTKGRVDPLKIATTLALANSVTIYLTKINSLGTLSVRGWINQTFPQMRITSAPELDTANGGANVGYLYADKVADSGSDDGATWIQAVPTKFRVLGVERRVKGYVEDFTNATAGSFAKRPYAITRITGI